MTGIAGSCKRFPPFSDQMRAPVLQAERHLPLTSVIPARAISAKAEKIRKPEPKLPVNCFARPSDEAR